MSSDSPQHPTSAENDEKNRTTEAENIEKHNNTGENDAKSETNAEPHETVVENAGSAAENVVQNDAGHVQKRRHKKSSRGSISGYFINKEHELKISLKDLLHKLSQKSTDMKVMNYIDNQMSTPGERSDSPEIEENKMMARGVLDNVLVNIDRVLHFEEAHAELKLRNEYHKFLLMDLAKSVPGFDINDTVMKKLAFRENLFVSRIDREKVSVPIGGMCLNVKIGKGVAMKLPVKQIFQKLNEACPDIKEVLFEDQSKPTPLREHIIPYIEYLRQEMKKDQYKFQIYLSSDFNVDGRAAGSRMTSWVTKHLHTLEEKRNEFIEASRLRPKRIIEKTSHLVMRKEHYDVHVKRGYFERDYCYRFRRTANFVGEGANFLLMRYLAQLNFIGTLEMCALHIEGGLAQNIYQCDGMIDCVINKEKIKAYRVYRSVIEECGDITIRSCTLLSNEGYILKHEWENCDYILHVSPYRSPGKKNPALIFHLEEIWKYDAELISRLTDIQMTTKKQMKSYLEDHKQIRGVIEDYIKTICLVQPENTVAFTKYFFLSYAPYFLPRREYFERLKHRDFEDHE